MNRKQIFLVEDPLTSHPAPQAIWGVFDFLSLQDQVGEPASGQPQPGCFGQQLLFDEFVPSEPGSIGIVFDLLYTWIE
jgi:hypothetical protein